MLLPSYRQIRRLVWQGAAVEIGPPPLARKRSSAVKRGGCIFGIDAGYCDTPLVFIPLEQVEQVPGDVKRNVAREDWDDKWYEGGLSVPAKRLRKLVLKECREMASAQSAAATRKSDHEAFDHDFLI